MIHCSSSKYAQQSILHIINNAIANDVESVQTARSNALLTIGLSRNMDGSTLNYSINMVF